VKFLVELDEQDIIKELLSEGYTNITETDLCEFIEFSVGCQLGTLTDNIEVGILQTTEEYYKNLIKLSEKYGVYK